MYQNIDIVIPVYAKKNLQVDSLVKSILNQDLGTIDKVNIFIVFNPVRSEQSIKWQKKIPLFHDQEKFSLKLIFCEDAGVNNARQIGVDHGQSNIIFFFDDDVILDKKNILKNHADFHIKNSEVFACGGYYSTDSHQGIFSNLYSQRQKQWLDEAFLDPQKIYAGYLIGGHFSVKRKLMQNNNLKFDVNIKFGSSETDFFLSACSMKQKLVLQRWSVKHALQDGPLRLLRKTYLQGRGKKMIENKGHFYKTIYRSILVHNRLLEKMIALLYDFTFSFGYYSLDHQYGLFLKESLQKFYLEMNYARQKLINYLRTDL